MQSIQRRTKSQAGQKEKVTTIHKPEAELRIEEITRSTGSIVRLQSVSTAIAPRVDEKIL